ncbi:MAG: pilus assembly protein PilM [Oscillospiraceae bacterium]|nr:pilus assembly protein PilM [Oscillospiraceae bacterium]MBQ5338318.1 pilus assembly protein PilM [Oscillospiraceae bacterium]
MLSFDITDRNIRIIKGTENNGRIRINSAATLNLEEEVIVNGHVRDVPRLATLINQVLRTNKMPDKEAIVSISSNMTIFKELHIQRAEKQQDFMKMVRAEMSAALGIDESYSVSYIVVGPSDQTEGADKVLATACPFEVVDCYKRVFNMLQISLKSVMIGCNCITKVLLADSKIKAKMPLLAVQIDNNFISLNLYEKGQLSFSRFASISAEDYDDSEDYVFEAVNENIFRMLQFQKSKPGSEMIENVVFYGDTHEYVRLTNELEKMGIRTSIINVPPQIHGYENLEFSSYANAIGAMFKRNKDTERINLLETDTVNNNKIRSDSSYFALLGICALVAAGLCAGVWGFLAIQNKVVKHDIDVLNEKMNSQLRKDLDAQNAMLTQRQTAVNTYVAGVRDAYNSFISTPKPVSDFYETIDATISGVVQDVLGVEDAEEVKDHYKYNKMDFANGAFAIELEMDSEEDSPMPVGPEKVVEALRGLDIVQSVSYGGYTIESRKIEEDDQQEGKDILDDDGNVIGKEEPKTEERIIKLPMTVKMNGGKIDLDTIGDAKEAKK